MDTTIAQPLSSGVTYMEADAILVGRIISSRGFAPADQNGYRLTGLEHMPWLGILCEDPLQRAVPKGIFSRIFPPTKRLIFLGVIEFQNFDTTICSEKWFFRVFGTSYVSHAVRLAEDIVKDCNKVRKVSIDLGLVSESARYEKLL